MTDAINTTTIECPACGLSGDVPAWWTGMVTECKDCGIEFSVEEHE